MALGESDYGLYGVVAGLTVIVMLAYTMRLVRGRSAAVGWKNGRSDKFFAWGGSTMCYPPVPLSEDDCAA